MIQKFVDRFMQQEHQDALRATFTAAHPSDYKAIVAEVVKILRDGYGSPDPDRILEINDGEYQGTLLYVIAADGYQPSDYWFVKVGYGSCSGCDTLEALRYYSDEAPTEKQIVQGLKDMQGEIV